MPPKAKITKEQVIEAAAGLVRSKGVAGLTAKSLAAELHCSTQPIFWLFEGMEEVRAAVKERALAVFGSYLREKRENASAYKSIGLNYIRFASEETEFFKMLFMSDSAGADILASHEEKPYVLRVLEEEENIKGACAQDIYEVMWLFSHGIATMIATGTAKFTQDRIREMLTSVYRGLIACGHAETQAQNEEKKS